LWRLSTFTYQANLLAAAFYRCPRRPSGHAPYYFLDPNSVGTVIVVVNMCAPGGCVLVLGYTLFAVNRAVATARIDSS
jgi:hypothetical protein